MNQEDMRECYALIIDPADLNDPKEHEAAIKLLRGFKKWINTQTNHCAHLDLEYSDPWQGPYADNLVAEIKDNFKDDDDDED